MKALPTQRGRLAGGFTLVELMVTMTISGVVSIAILTMMTQLTGAFNAQMRLATAQQTGRAAGDLIGRELRMAGYLVDSGLTVALQSEGEVARAFPVVSVENGTSASEFSDAMTVAYADTSAQTAIANVAGNLVTAAETIVESTAGFAVGDLVVASRNGLGCVMKITSLAADRFGHTPGGIGYPWNTSTNAACAGLTTGWSNGETMVSKLTVRTYRVRPGDPRGVLEFSPTARVVANDWIELADGVIDLQLAIQVREPGDATDLDGDGDPTLDWYSGDAMANALYGPPLPAPQKTPMELHVALATRGELNDAAPGTMSPELCTTTLPANNAIGDHCGVAIDQVTDPSSRYYRAALLRKTSLACDLRNLGTGVGTP